MEQEEKIKKQKEKQSPVWWMLFIVYLFLLFYLLFFSETYGRTMTERSYRYNLEFFKEIKRFWENRDTLGWHSVIVNLIGNVAAFAPFGFFVAKLTRIGKHVFFCVPTTALFSLLVELIQLVTKVGAFDVDDIFLNAVGGLVGFFCYVCIWRPMETLLTRKKE